MEPVCNLVADGIAAPAELARANGADAGWPTVGGAAHPGCPLPVLAQAGCGGGGY